VLEYVVILDPDLTAGPIHCRLFEADPAVAVSPVHGTNGQRNEVRSAGSE